MKVERKDVVAFRLNAHHLVERLERDAMEIAAAGCGIQNSPPGSALLALHARVRDVTRYRMDHAVAGEKRLLQTWSMRGAPFYVPTADASVFTTGVLPPTEAALRHFIPGVEQAVDRLGISVTQAVELTGAEIGGVLSGRQLAITELGAEVAERIARQLSETQRSVWQEEGPYAPGQPIGEAVVHFCIRILTLQRVVCLAPRAGNKAPFVLVEQWLGHPVADVDPDAARAELLRRYLRCYGPSTRGDFAAWLGIRAGDAGPWWRQVDDELIEVEFGRRSWMLAEDLDTLRSAPTPTGVRLLPPRDPYTQLRDRETIVARPHFGDVWRTVGEPGAVLADGEITGTWRRRKSGRRLTIAVISFDRLSARFEQALLSEAEQIASLRGASAVDVTFET